MGPYLMVTTSELRKALGKRAENLSDDEVARVSALLERLAKSLFTQWHKELVSNRKQSQIKNVAV